MFEVLKKHLQNQTIVKPCMLSVIAALIVNLVGNVVFVYILDWGFIGSPIATVLSQWTMFFVTIIYIILNPDCRKVKKTLSFKKKINEMGFSHFLFILNLLLIF